MYGDVQILPQEKGFGILINQGWFPNISIKYCFHLMITISRTQDRTKQNLEGEKTNRIHEGNNSNAQEELPSQILV